MYRRGPFVGYAFALALSLLAVEQTWHLSFIIEGTFFFLFLAVVIVTALYGGLGPGLVATVLTSLAIVFSPPPIQPLGIESLNGRLRLGLYIIVAAFVSFLVASQPKNKKQEPEELYNSGKQ